MIEESARVLSSANGFAQVEAERRAACGSCSQRSGCGTSLVAEAFGNRRSRIQVLNPIDARAGDRVVIGLDERVLVKASLLLYLVPLLGLILGALGGDLWAARSVQLASPEAMSITGGGIGLLLGLFWVRRWAKRSRFERGLRAVILRPE